MKKLVVYYSLEGNTKLVAEAVAEAAEADLIRLVPSEQPSKSGAAPFARLALLASSLGVLSSRRSGLASLSKNFWMAPT